MIKICLVKMISMKFFKKQKDQDLNMNFVPYGIFLNIFVVLFYKKNVPVHLTQKTPRIHFTCHSLNS